VSGVRNGPWPWRVGSWFWIPIKVAGSFHHFLCFPYYSWRIFFIRYCFRVKIYVVPLLTCVFSDGWCFELLPVWCDLVFIFFIIFTRVINLSWILPNLRLVIWWHIKTRFHRSK
jgi:hypothetical protein